MFKISVPVMNANVTRCGREKVLKQLKRFNAERVFLAPGRYWADKEKRMQSLKELRENCTYFKANGFEVGACACLTSWDIDGTDAAELLGILAGKTRPFARLIGAPYWAAKGEWGSKLQDVIELEKMESSWTESENIELFAEGGFLPKTENPMPRKLFRGI